METPAPERPARPDEPRGEAGRRDYLVRRNGRTCAGVHLLADFWGAEGLGDAGLVEAALREAAEGAGASVLHVHVRRFDENGGATGIALLAESHVSIHTWPEIDYAAIDVFTCGACRPDLAVEQLKARLRPRRADVRECERGRLA